MLAFLDSPVQLMVAAVVILVVFGPQKLPEIAGQIGRALRELKRTTGELQDSFNLDHHRYDQHYDPPQYDSYGNPTTDTHTTPSVPEADVWQPSTPEMPALTAASSSEPVRGDFAASALSDAGSEYGYVEAASQPVYNGASAYAAPAVVADSNVSTAGQINIRPAEGSVSRSA